MLMSHPVKPLLFAAIFLVFTLGLCRHSYGNSSAVPVKKVVTQESWDDWPCKNLKTDWNYLFHPDRINQYQPPRDTIDQSQGEDQSWLDAIQRKQ